MAEAHSSFPKTCCDGVACAQESLVFLCVCYERGRGFRGELVLFKFGVIEECLLDGFMVNTAHTYAYQSQWDGALLNFVKHFVKLRKPGKLIGSQAWDLALTGVYGEIFMANFQMKGCAL